MYILLTRPDLVSRHLHLIDNVKLYSSENKQVFESIMNFSENLSSFKVEKLDIDKDLIDRIMNYASVKHIIKKNNENEEKILEIFSEIIQDLKNYELEQRILDLESKFTQDLSEDTFNELKELKKLQKIN